MALLAARTEAIKRYRARDPTLDDAEINARLVAYCSDQACTHPQFDIAIFYLSVCLSVCLSVTFGVVPKRLNIIIGA